MTTCRRIAASLLALAAGLSLSLAAGTTYDVDRAHSSLTFSIRHLLTSVQGHFNEFRGTVEYDADNPSASAVSLTAQTASIDTGVAKRDTHLKSADFFDAERFPALTFKSEKVVPKGKDELEVTGALTMHGVTRTVTVPVKVLGVLNTKEFGAKAGFETRFTVNRKDFGISWNKVLDSGGTLLGDEVTIAINVEANGKPAEPGKS